MTELTPEAQAVVDAFYRELPPNYQQGGITAALRAVADVLDFEEVPSNWTSENNGILWSRRKILDIAEELETQSNSLGQ